MAILKIARMGHPILRRVADAVPREKVRAPEIQRLIRDMLDTVRDYEGVGLAAPQVHASVRIVVLSLRSDNRFDVWINPRLRPLTDEHLTTLEGCLSVPGIRGAVNRPGEVEVEALDPDGDPICLQLSGYPAVVAQHECDHLDGVLFVERADPRTLAFVEELRRFRDSDVEE